MLRYYLQFDSPFKNQTWTRADLTDRIREEINSKDRIQSLKNKILAIFDDDDKVQNSPYKSQPIRRMETKNKVSSVALFDKMRKIRTDKLYLLDEDELFIYQGKFMETCTDDYSKQVSLLGYNPTYDTLNNGQLRTYFTWRTKTRNGRLTKTSISYVVLYIYELINNIGVKNPKDGIEKLIWLLKDYSQFNNQMEEYLVVWIKSYYICNKFEVSFKEIVETYKLEPYYPSVISESTENKYCYRTMHNLSKYKFEGSKFYTEENKAFIVHCFDEVIHNITPLLSSYGTGWDEMVLGTMEQMDWWNPFDNVIYKEMNALDKTVTISKNEVYVRQGGVWRVYVSPRHSKIGSNVIEYIIKCIEADLRVFKNHRRKLTPNIDSLFEYIGYTQYVSKRMIAVISDAAFREIIEETTKLELTALLSAKENTEIPSTSKNLNAMLNKEPYLTFLKMRGSDTLKMYSDKTARFKTQAQILANLTDNFETIIPYDGMTYMRQDIYEDMSNEQLRYYVTWRSNVRNGEYSEIPNSYLYLYIYELINQIEERDADKVIEKLALLIQNYSKLGKSFVKLVTTCIKDFYICEDMASSFYEVIKKHGIASYYKNVSIEFSNDFELDLLKRISNYDISKSKFYSEQTAPIIDDCFRYVFEAIVQYFEENQLDFKKIIAGKGYKREWFKPFRDTICDKKPTSNKIVILCSNEIYSFKNNVWYCELLPDNDNTDSILIGYMFKRMEAKIREILVYKYKFSANVSILVKKLSNRQKIRNAVEHPTFNQTIDDVVMRYFKENHPRVFANPNAPFEKTVAIKIDKSKLNKIREESDTMRDKLTLEEDIPEITTVSQPDIKIVTKISKQYSSPLEELCSNLTELQKETVIIILNESPSMPAIMALAQKNKIMPEILLDGINELSLDIICDNLIETAEENLLIYDDYINDIKMFLEVK